MTAHADLEALAARFNTGLDPGVAARLGQYLELLLTWNRAINLTGAGTRAELVEEHLPDSFAVARLVGQAPTVVDVGSGGGLPGVPLALLCPGTRVTLAEPRAKRRAFLTQAVHQLGLTAAVSEARAEELAPGTFSLAVARAVFPPAEWLEVGARLVVPGGQVVVLLPADSPWSPPTSCRVVDEVRYSAGPRSRLALALTVPRGT